MSHTVDIVNCLSEFQKSVQAFSYLINKSENSKENHFEGETKVEHVTQEQIEAVGHLVSDRTTKFSVAFTEIPKSEDCKPLTDMLGQEIFKLISVSSWIVFNDVEFCGTLRSQVREATVRILQSISELLESYITKIKKQQNPSSPKLTGVIWEACKQFQSIELDNFKAAKKEIHRWLPLIKDAIKELEELCSVKQEIEDNFFDDLEDEELSPEQKKFIAPCVTLSKCSFQLVKKVVDFIASSEGTPAALKPDSKVLDEFVEVCKKIVEYVDQLGTSVYPPQTMVLSSASTLVSQHNSLIEHLKSVESNELTVKFLSLIQQKQTEAISEIQSLLSAN